MKRIAFSLAIFLSAFIPQAYGQPQMLDVKTFGARLAAIQDKTVLDVRTSDEYTQGHLANAVMIDYYKPDFRQHLAKFDKTKPVFVYCAAGVRSDGASKTLQDLGFKQIYNLQGGINAWKKAKMPIVK